MNRANPYRIFLVLAVMVAGALCLLLPEKNAAPVANMGEAVKGKPSVVTDSNAVRPDSLQENNNPKQ